MLDYAGLVVLSALFAAAFWPVRGRGHIRRSAWLAASMLSACALCYVISRAREFQLLGRAVARVETRARVVALTFDDGPWDETTAEVLDLLRTHQLRATFFVVGREASTYPDALRAIVAAGHEVGNHTWTHRRLLGMSQATLASEVERTDAVIRDAQYPGPILFRPPHGKRLLDASYYLAHHDRLAIMWDVQPDSERGIADDPAAMTRHLMQHVKPGAIVLMHVLHPARTASRTALPAMIEALKHTGYRFVTVSELLALEPQHMAEATSVHLWNH